MLARTVRSRLGTLALALTATGSGVGGVLAGLGVPTAATSAITPSAHTAGLLGAAPGVAGERFLGAGQLPRGSRFGSWSAGPPTAGLPVPEAFCLDGALPSTSTTHVGYRGGREVRLDQYVTRMGAEPGAAELTDDLRTRIERCYRDWLDQRIPAYGDAHRRASWQRYGTSAVADGLTVFGVFTVPPDGRRPATHLYAVGRDGPAVLTVHMALPGRRGHAPVEKFAATAATALRRAF